MHDPQRAHPPDSRPPSSPRPSSPWRQTLRRKARRKFSPPNASCLEALLPPSANWTDNEFHRAGPARFLESDAEIISARINCCLNLRRDNVGGCFFAADALKAGAMSGQVDELGDARF